MSAGGGNEPNLTPFIDLFSVLICFLLMTAAWLQLDSMNTSIEKSTSSDAPETSAPDKKAQLSVTIEPEKVVFKVDDKGVDIANNKAGIDTPRIKQELIAWKARFPKRTDMIVNTATGVAYGSLISIYDLLITTGWPDVGINPQ